MALRAVEFVVVVAGYTGAQALRSNCPRLYEHLHHWCEVLRADVHAGALLPGIQSALYIHHGIGTYEFHFQFTSTRSQSTVRIS